MLRREFASLQSGAYKFLLRRVVNWLHNSGLMHMNVGRFGHGRFGHGRFGLGHFGLGCFGLGRFGLAFFQSRTFRITNF